MHMHQLSKDEDLPKSGLTQQARCGRRAAATNVPVGSGGRKAESGHWAHEHRTSIVLPEGITQPYLDPRAVRVATDQAGVVVVHLEEEVLGSSRADFDSNIGRQHKAVGTGSPGVKEDS